MDSKTARVDWTRSNETAHELYAAHDDDGRSFDYAGYNVNVAEEHPQVVHAFFEQVKSAVEAWY